MNYQFCFRQDSDELSRYATIRSDPELVNKKAFSIAQSETFIVKLSDSNS